MKAGLNPAKELLHPAIVKDFPFSLLVHPVFAKAVYQLQA